MVSRDRFRSGFMWLLLLATKLVVRSTIASSLVLPRSSVAWGGGPVAIIACGLRTVIRRMAALPFQGLPGRARLIFMAPFLASRAISFRRNRRSLETGESGDRLFVLELVLDIAHSIGRDSEHTWEPDDSIVGPVSLLSRGSSDLIVRRNKAPAVRRSKWSDPIIRSERR